MANFFFYDAHGQKVGPMTGVALKALAQQGVITPEIIVENEQGKSTPAGKVKGLVFSSNSAAPSLQSVYDDLAIFTPEVQAVPVPQPAPKQLHCTNCGNVISEQAVACMSCGAKPTGYKNFCRQCGVALNPEQVVCVKCGASIAATIMPDAKRVVQSVTSSFSPFIEKIKILPKPAIIAGIAAVAVVGILCLAYDYGSDNPSAVVRKFDAALKSGDKKTQGQLATPETMEMLALFGEKVENSSKMSGKIKSCESNITGDIAVVHVIWENNKPEDVSLKKIDGKWKIHFEVPKFEVPEFNPHSPW